MVKKVNKKGGYSIHDSRTANDFIQLCRYSDKSGLASEIKTGLGVQEKLF